MGLHLFYAVWSFAGLFGCTCGVICDMAWPGERDDWRGMSSERVTNAEVYGKILQMGIGRFAYEKSPPQLPPHSPKGASRLSGPWSVLWPGYFLSQSLAVVTLQPDHMLIFWSSLDPSKVLSCFCLVNWWCSFISDQSIQTISKASAWLYYKDYCYLHILHSVYFKGLTICNGDVMRCPCEPVNQWIGESLYGLTAKPSSQPLSRFASPQNVPLRDLRYFIAPVHIFSFQWFLINLCSRYRYLIVYIVYRERNSLIEINLY